MFFNIYALIHNFSFYLLLTIFLFSFLFLFSDLRRKFIKFIFIIILYSVWGFLIDLDGLFLVFITAEFTIFLLLLMTYLQLYSNFNFLSSKIPTRFALFSLVFFIFNYNPFYSFYSPTSYYKALHHLVSSDFYILYYFLFEKFPLLVVLLTLIISFFSLFFIVMYFSLKLTKANAHKTLKTLHFLRKQVLTKQVNFSSKVYTFQN